MYFEADALCFEAVVEKILHSDQQVRRQIFAQLDVCIARYPERYAFAYGLAFHDCADLPFDDLFDWYKHGAAPGVRDSDEAREFRAQRDEREAWSLVQRRGFQ